VNDNLSTPDPSAARLVTAAKQAHRELGEALIDLHEVEHRIAAVRRELSVAVTSYDSAAVTPLPDDPHRDPRD
jgi:hypothetical protein